MYKYSAKIRYALIGLYDIMLYGKKRPVPLSDIIRREKVPKVYMERIMSKLVKAGILKSKKGAMGGFAFNKKLKDISIFNLYQIFAPDIENNDNHKDLKNKKVKEMMEKTKTSIDEQTSQILKSHKLNTIISYIKKKGKQKKEK